MVFSSQLFLYGFMPVFFSLYYLVPWRCKNQVILVGSLVFYTIGGGAAVFVLIASILVNQFVAVQMDTASDVRRKYLLIAGIVLNVLALGYYKYTDFVWQTISDGVSTVGLNPLPAAPVIPLPIGISFFTFQAISYIIDVYTGEISRAGSYGQFALYHTLFPQLVAGPIVRYREIKSELEKRRVDRIALTEGAYRFALGLGKKIVIADNLAITVDSIFALRFGQLSALQAWLGIVCYALQIYYDFSGYSDMAIGLGRMMGFHFPENFDQPYRSTSITEFWRRWHMTLMRWLRDYVFTPLAVAGRRRGKLWTMGCLMAVFFLCGLWHGAGFTFIVWGLYHGFLLVIEYIAKIRLGWKPSGYLGTAWTLILVLIGYVFFRSPTLVASIRYLDAMLFLSPARSDFNSLVYYMTPDMILYLYLGLFFAFTPFGALAKLQFGRPALLASQLGLASISLVYSLLLLAANSFNPFIYFRF